MDHDLRNPINEKYLLWVTTSDVSTTELPKELQDRYADLIVDDLPPTSTTTTVKHEIELVPGTAPIAKRAYRLSPVKRAELEQQIKELISSGRISPSDSPFAAPVLFVKKKDGSSRLCVDYRGLNNATVKSKFPLPLIEDVLDSLHGAKIFSKLDLISGYHQVSVNEPDRYKTSFITHEGQYQWNVMPFGLTNAPATFQRLMNAVLRPYISKFCVVYLDDILIYSKTREEHLHHISQVLDKLRKHSLYPKKSKCHFMLTQVQFLGHVINANGISTDPEKINAIKQWPILRNYKDAQRFLGLANYYRRFIKNFSKMASPLYEFAAKKNTKWTTECHNAFISLKDALISAPILIAFDPKSPYQLTMTVDASDNCIGATLEYKDGRKPKGVIAYLSHKLHSYETRWHIRDKELYAIVFALKKWTHYVQGSHVIIYTDHKTNVNLNRLALLSPRLARWAEVLANYDFEIKYIPGPRNHADILSHPPGEPEITDSTDNDLIEIDSDHTDVNNKQGNSPETQHLAKVFFDPRPIKDLKNVTIETINAEVLKDPYYENIAQYIRDPNRPIPSKYFELVRRFRYFGDILVYQDKQDYVVYRVCIPKTLVHEIIREHHDTPLFGHRGADTTYKHLLKGFYWPNMLDSIKQYIKRCPECRKGKHPTTHPYGPLHSHPIPNQRWSEISIDFIDAFKTSGDNKYDRILTIVDNFTKMAHFIPCRKKDFTAEMLTDIFIQNIIKLHGRPLRILSDNDVLYTATAWTAVMNRLQIHRDYTTVASSSSNSFAERTNRTIEEILNTLVAHSPTKWSTYLPLAEFAYNNSYQATIDTTPFFANQGYHPLAINYYMPMQGDNAPYKLTDHPTIDEHQEAQEALYLKIKQKIADQNAAKALKNNVNYQTHAYQPGDQVVVHQSVYKPPKRDEYNQLKQISKKPHYVWYGPFTIKAKKTDQTYLVRTHNRLDGNLKEFHIRHMRPYYKKLLPKRNVPPIDTAKADSVAHESTNVINVDWKHNDWRMAAQWAHCEPWDYSIYDQKDKPLLSHLEQRMDMFDTTISLKQALARL